MSMKILFFFPLIKKKASKFYAKDQRVNRNIPDEKQNGRFGLSSIVLQVINCVGEAGFTKDPRL